MSTQGPKYPGSASDDGSVGSVAWANASRIEADDGNTATVSLGGSNLISNYLKATNFGFSIPTASTVTNVKIEIKVGQSASGAEDYSCKLVRGGSVAGSELAGGAVPATSPQYIEYDGTGGLGLTDSDVNDSGFGVAWAGQYTGGSGTILSADAVRLTLTYEPTGDSTSIIVSAGVVNVNVVAADTEGTLSAVPGQADVAAAVIAPTLTLGAAAADSGVASVTLDVPDLAIIRGAIIVGAGVASVGVHADPPALALTLAVHPGAAEVSVVLQNPAPLVFGEPFVSVTTVEVDAPAITLSAVSVAAGAVEIYATIGQVMPVVSGAAQPAAGVADVAVAAVNPGLAFAPVSVSSLSTGMNVFVPPLAVVLGDLPPAAGAASLSVSVAAPSVTFTTQPIPGLGSIDVSLASPTVSLSALSIAAPVAAISVSVVAPSITLGAAETSPGVVFINCGVSGPAVMPQRPAPLSAAVVVIAPAVFVAPVSQAAGVASIAVSASGSAKIWEAVSAVEIGVSIVSTHAPTNAPPVTSSVSVVGPTFTGQLAVSAGVARVGLVVTAATANGVPYGLVAGVASVGVSVLGTTWQTQCAAGVAVVDIVAVPPAFSPDGYAGRASIGVAVAGPLVSPKPLAGVAVVSVSVPNGPAWAAAGFAVLTVSATGPTWRTAALAGIDATGVAVVSPSVALGAIRPPLGSATVEIDVSQQATVLSGLTDAAPSDNVGVSITAPAVVLGTATATAGVATIGASSPGSSATISGAARPAVEPVEIGVAAEVSVPSQGVVSPAATKATWIPAQRPTLWTLPKRSQPVK